MTFQQVVNTVLGNPRALLGLLVIGMPVLRGVIKVLRNKKAERDARARLDRAELESLRTGRPASEEVGLASMELPRVSAEQKLQEIAERRRAMIEQARARAMAARQRPAAQAPAYDPRVAMASEAMSAPAGGVAPARKRVRRARPAAPAQESTRDAQRALTDNAAQQVREAARRIDSAAAARSEEPAPRPRDAGGLRGMTRSQWRRALVLREVLAPPVALRSGQGDRF